MGVCRLSYRALLSWFLVNFTSPEDSPMHFIQGNIPIFLSEGIAVYQGVGGWRSNFSAYKLYQFLFSGPELIFASDKINCMQGTRFSERCWASWLSTRHSPLRSKYCWNLSSAKRFLFSPIS